MKEHIWCFEYLRLRKLPMVGRRRATCRIWALRWFHRAKCAAPCVARSWCACVGSIRNFNNSGFYRGKITDHILIGLHGCMPALDHATLPSKQLRGCDASTSCDERHAHARRSEEHTSELQSRS